MLRVGAAVHAAPTGCVAFMRVSREADVAFENVGSVVMHAAVDATTWKDTIHALAGAAFPKVAATPADVADAEARNVRDVCGNRTFVANQRQSHACEQCVSL